MLGVVFAGALGWEGSLGGLGGQGHREDADGLSQRRNRSLRVRQAQEDPRGSRERRSPRTSGESSAEE